MFIGMRRVNLPHHSTGASWGLVYVHPDSVNRLGISYTLSNNHQDLMLCSCSNTVENEARGFSLGSDWFQAALDHLLRKERENVPCSSAGSHQLDNEGLCGKNPNRLQT